MFLVDKQKFIKIHADLSCTRGSSHNVTKSYCKSAALKNCLEDDFEKRFLNDC